MGRNTSQTQESLTAWQTHKRNVFKVLDDLANKIVDNTEDADFWKEDLDLKKILYKADVPVTTFRNNHGYQMLNERNGIKNAGRLCMDFNPQRWVSDRERIANGGKVGGELDE